MPFVAGSRGLPGKDLILLLGMIQPFNRSQIPRYIPKRPFWAKIATSAARFD